MKHALTAFFKTVGIGALVSLPLAGLGALAYKWHFAGYMLAVVLAIFFLWAIGVIAEHLRETL